MGELDVILESGLHPIQLPLEIIAPVEWDVGAAQLLQACTLNHQIWGPSFELCCGPADGLNVFLASWCGEVKECLELFLRRRHEHCPLAVPHHFRGLQASPAVYDPGTELEFARGDLHVPGSADVQQLLHPGLQLPDVICVREHVVDVLLVPRLVPYLGVSQQVEVVAADVEALCDTCPEVK